MKTRNHLTKYNFLFHMKRLILHSIKHVKNQNHCPKTSVYPLKNDHLITKLFRCVFQREKEQNARNIRFSQTSIDALII